MAARTAEERLAELQERRKREEERLARLKAQEKDLLKKQKEQERKQRTRRLILCGAAIEKAYETVKTVKFQNAYYRHDIGQRALRGIR